ncbi:heat-inducible transcription repressor HrcA [Corallococcus sp. AB004]|uniref:heat-inducible transcriptional repressor HrcA n=1 Tax=Corallococcus TaxID=83461 RepID=UPI000EA21ABE|nr:MULTISPECIES: heat-inducible transcriptional repressor HrcA [Corallococcus]RKI38164.1 heat-inducible transcription repressor HrcA [Corallococcus sp. AB004]MBN8473075.1 heat-inducible transcription repressor HrcA [Corallococcus exiguus]NPC71549.1 heat-inducible transcription repressor HrcA [Corallococcus exiguus]NPD28773.1 heat-inducible transcription repressor HrcA [Corallococcus exiguus]NRD47847.1 heat-inducible transcription repressor HrcA [Corallococcus exiguus]
MPDELGEREKEVLRAVVQEYITTGGPVGSQQLTRRGEFEVSSATMRNVLADLEALGFLEKPHTSAGRVPTDRGYRFYVDTLVKLRDPAPRDRELIHAGLVHESNLDDILSEASRVLHSLTRHAGVVLTPRADAAVFQRIEFLRLRENRVLAVLVGQNGQVHNKALTVDFPVTSDELIKASNYLSELLHQVPLEEARERIRAEMDQEQALYNALTAKALKLGAAATDLQTPERVLIEGTGSFLEQPEFADVERIRALFRALDEKHKLLHLLDRVQRTKEMHVFIGAESEFSAAGDVTVIASPYGTAEAVLGTVGVIGPTRMDYRRVIPLVNFTAQVLSSVLEKA